MKTAVTILFAALALLSMAVPAPAQVPPELGSLLCSTLGVGCPTYVKVCEPPIGLGTNACSCDGSDTLIGGGGICFGGGSLVASVPCGTAPAFGFALNCAADGVPANSWVIFCSTFANEVTAICVAH